MEKLDQYLDRVCRGIGGPRSLRKHVRQELREHLLDAIARYQEAGLNPDEAIDRALEEFGTSDEVKSELEATHGHRVMAMVIDKALQWKEMTMKAKWLWTSWALVGLAIVITLEVLFITFIAMFIAPKFQLLLHHGMLDPAVLDEPAVSWMLSFLNGVWSAGEYATFLAIAAAVAWGLFEWRVRSENKTLMRLSALATAGVALMVIVVFTAGSLVILFCLGMPATGQLAQPFAIQQLSHLNAATTELQQAAEAKDWQAMQEKANRAASALDNLANVGPALPSLISKNVPPTLQELRAHVQLARETLSHAQRAIREMDPAQLDTAMTKYRKAQESLREAAKTPQK
jgi:hypothetical protein